MHVAVLGAGYAGIAATRQLETALADDVELTLVDERETHLVQHLIHRAVREPSLSEELTMPLSELLERANHRQATVTDVDPDAGTVEFSDGALQYDAGIVALGAETAFYGLPGVREQAVALKRLEHATRIREGFESVPANGRVVVCGAGLSGVQIAGELAALGRDRGTEPAVVLVEQEGTVAPRFSEPFQRALADELDQRGVTVRTNATVTGVDAETLHLAGEEQLGYDQLLWTGGIAGGGALAGNRPQVRATLRLGDRTLGAGDAVQAVDADGQLAPASAQTAVRQAGVAATNAERLLEHHRAGASGFEPRLDRYRYTSPGWVVSVGNGTVAQVGGSVLRGSAARAVKTTVAAGYLGQLGSVESAASYAREQLHHE